MSEEGADQSREGEEQPQENGAATESTGWRFARVFARPISSIVTGLAVAFVAVIGHQMLDRREKFKLFADLMTQREVAESELRKNMFDTILSSFLYCAKDSSATNATIEQDLLRLELLATNFSETLNLTPLFEDFDRHLANKVEFRDYRKRLQRMAKLVTASQLSRLETEGTVFDIVVHDLEAVGDTVFLFAGTRTLGEYRRYYEMKLEPHVEETTVEVSLLIKDEDGPGIGPEGEIYKERSFELSYYDFPLLNNTRLSGDQRFALVLSQCKEGYVEITGVCFPGRYSSTRDRPFFEEALQRLKKGSG